MSLLRHPGLIAFSRPGQRQTQPGQAETAPAGFAIRSPRHHGDQLGGGDHRVWDGPIVARTTCGSSARFATRPKPTRFARKRGKCRHRAVSGIGLSGWAHWCQRPSEGREGKAGRGAASRPREREPQTGRNAAGTRGAGRPRSRCQQPKHSPCQLVTRSGTAALLLCRRSLTPTADRSDRLPMPHRPGFTAYGWQAEQRHPPGCRSTRSMRSAS
jgi:hypothetical protein